MVRSRLIGVGAACVAAVALMVPTSSVARAQVDIPVSDVLVFGGQATITSDSGTAQCFNGICMPTTPPGCVDMPDTPGVQETPKVDLIGGCGSFSFSTAEPAVGSVCAGVSDPNEGTTPPSPEAGTCTISSTGSYGNEVCGTGVANGTASINSTFDNGTATFSILFVATIGVVVGSENEATANGDPGGSDLIVGVVQLGPGVNNPGPLPDGAPDCTGGFGIAGVLVGLDVP